MSQSKNITLDDNEVSRMMAELAMHDTVFRSQLLDCVKPDFFTPYTRYKRKQFGAVSQLIPKIRQQLVDQAELRIPDLATGTKQDLNTYLKKVTNSRVLVSRANTKKVFKSRGDDMEGDGQWGWVGTPICVARLAVAFLQSTLRFQADPTPFHFERLPPELRLQVYREAVSGIACVQSITVAPRRTKNKYSNFRFEGHSRGESKEINVGLLTAGRLVNNEATAILYQSRTFNFTTNVSSIAPFLQSVSEQARKHLHGIVMELFDKTEPDYCCHPLNKFWGKGPDNRAAWSTACKYIAENLNVKHLSLIVNVKIPEDFKSLTWVKDLVKIKELKSLMLEANQHEGSGPAVIRASYKEGSVSATEHCDGEYLVPCFEYLREEMLE